MKTKKNKRKQKKKKEKKKKKKKKKKKHKTKRETSTKNKKKNKRKTKENKRKRKKTKAAHHSVGDELAHIAAQIEALKLLQNRREIVLAEIGHFARKSGAFVGLGVEGLKKILKIKRK